MGMFYVGSYSGNKPSGISVCELAGEKLTLKKLYELKNATYLTLSRSGKYLYAGLEKDGGTGVNDGIVRAYEIGADDSLDFINEVTIEGNHSCHLSVSADDGFLFAANYAEDFISIFGLGVRGEISRPISTIRHNGSSVNRLRQEKAHPHFAAEIDGLGLAVCDLGLDKVIVYGNTSGYTAPEAVYCLESLPGSGPRHFEYRNGVMYVINELSFDITVCRLSRDGFDIIGHVPLCSKITPSPDSTAAAVKLSPDGKFLAASLRGTDIISVFAIDGASGIPRLLSENPANGKYPRDFSFDPSGGYIVCAYQNSDDIALFKFIPENGGLEELDRLSGIVRPVCVKFRG